MPSNYLLNKVHNEGLGGLSLYHALIKNKDKKEFNVKIFERESSPTDRWQGYHIGLSNYGAQSLLNCIPSSIAANLPKAMPNPVPDVETHGIIITDQVGNVLLAPPTKPFKDVYELAKISRGLSSMITYRDRLRDVLLEGVPVKCNKKCNKYVETQEGIWVFFEDGTQEFCNILVGADGINSPIRKQKLPELQIVNYGITHVGVDISIPKHLMDRASKIHGNVLARKTLGTKGDSTFMMTRLIPIKQEQNVEKNEPHYRATLVYSYPSELDNVDTESEKTKVDDNDPASVIEHVKRLIRTLRPDCELTDLLLELWDLAPKTIPNDPIKFPFKNYNPVQRRMMRDIDPMSIKSWTKTKEGVWVSFEDGTQEFCNILVGADRINSPNISIPKHLMDKANKIHGNVLARKTLGTKGDSTFMMTRLIPIKQEQNDEKNEPHYRATLVYSYPSELDNVESEKVKVDDNDPSSVIEHVKRLIRTLRPDCELTNLLLLELWDLAPKTIPNDPIKFPFKTYNPIQRRMMRDIDPMSIK
ncbi:hypothetical protein RhiirC2_870552 [Rhizophagus irregularis]|uniref:FAD-binding domain-containing protein n=1 Tax=Rhizophagus irregularis TaxID=588596 RepID=A0A2N1MIL2_9GLOM|nr:hypothetical protein RhiirC2_870552 [Rhizophagus irregularis]